MIYKCIDCNKLVSRKETKRCNSCFGKLLSKKLKGRKFTKSHLNNIRIANKKQIGNKNSVETLKRKSLAQFKRYGSVKRIKNIKGYIRIWKPDHPMAYAGRIYEHRYVMENKIGRFLEKKEIVHHLNAIKHDNRISNLYLTDMTNHRKVELKHINCPKCHYEFNIRIY